MMQHISTTTLDLDIDEMYVESEFIDSFEENQCYLPIFRSDLSKKARGAKSTDSRSSPWLIGQYLLSKYYMVFDQSPSTVHDLPYLRVGFGLIKRVGGDSPQLQSSGTFGNPQDVFD